MTATAFWDSRATRYAAQPIADPAAYEEMLHEVRSILRPLDRVLELGCGTGSTALVLAPSVSEIVATDSSEKMIEIARNKLDGSAPSNVQFEQADAAAEREPGSFDAVLAFSLLHLVDDIPAVLSSVREQLKPGGLFISKTVCIRSSWFIRAMVRVLTALGIAPRVQPLSREDLVAMLEGAGFEVVSSTYFDRRKRNPFLVAKRVD